MEDEGAYLHINPHNSLCPPAHSESPLAFRPRVSCRWLPVLYHSPAVGRRGCKDKYRAKFTNLNQPKRRVVIPNVAHQQTEWALFRNPSQLVVMPVDCCLCKKSPAVLKRPKTGQAACKECFFEAVESEVHQTIISNRLFRRGEVVAIGASGGKDSTVLAYLMKTLNQRHDYGLDLFLLSIDEGITGYRDDSLETVRRNETQYGIPLKILSYQELYGWTMDRIVATMGRRNNCTFCGVFRRQALDRGAAALGVDKIVTGHNADDIAETVIMNILRGDVARLRRCTAITTIQVHLREGDSHVRLLQEARLLLHRVRVLTQCLPRPRTYLPQRPGENKTKFNH